VQKESQPASWNFSSRSSDWSKTFNPALCGSKTDQQMPFTPQQCFIHIIQPNLLITTLVYTAPHLLGHTFCGTN
jgi:hypothetical protein